MKKKLLFTSIIALPTFVFAQSYDQDLFGLLQYALDLLQNLGMYLIFAFAVLFFLWRVLQYIRKPEEFSKTGKWYILFGLIALTVMFTFYAIIRLFASTFNLQVGIPQFVAPTNIR